MMPDVNFNVVILHVKLKDEELFIIINEKEY